MLASLIQVERGNRLQTPCLYHSLIRLYLVDVDIILHLLHSLRVLISLASRYGELQAHLEVERVLSLNFGHELLHCFLLNVA